MQTFTKFKTWVTGRRQLVAGLLIGVVLSGGSALVMAAIPDANGVIHACYDTKKFYVIDSPSQTCKSGETALTWNQTGPQGPAGAPGPQGPAGSGLGGFVSSLVGADLRNADLRYRQMSNMDLHDASLMFIKTLGADFRNTNFTNVNLGSTDLSGDFRGANFTNAHIEDTAGTGGDFRGANFQGATLSTRGSLSSSNFSGVDFRNTTIGTRGISWNSSDLTNTNFSGKVIGGFNAPGSNLSGADLSGTTLTNGKIENAITNGTNFTGASITGFGFTDTDLTSANLAGVVWSDVTCPDGTNSDANGATCIGHLVP